MKDNDNEFIKNNLKYIRNKKIYNIVLSIVATIILFVTIYVLILPARALTKSYYGGIAAMSLYSVNEQSEDDEVVTVTEARL